MTPQQLAELLAHRPDIEADYGAGFEDINAALLGMDAPHASEHEAQVAVFAWAAENTGRWPDLALLHAIPNGGHRHRAVGARMKAEGQRAGVPDISLPIPRGPYHGAYVEMKHGRNKPTSAQLWWLDALGQQGYFCAVCFSAAEAESVLAWYLGLSDLD